VAVGRRAQVFIVSGPSGSGKTTVVEHLLRVLPDLLFSVSYTTRTPRAGEQDGREYHFISQAQFEEMRARGEFLEYASVFGHSYGTHRSVLENAARQGKDLLLDIDVQGAQQVKTRLPDAVAILVLPPSSQELERRLLARGLDTPATMRRRLECARQEIERYQTYDYVVVNRDIGETCAQVEAILVAGRNQDGGGQAPSRKEEQAAARAAAARREINLEQVSAILGTFGARTP